MNSFLRQLLVWLAFAIVLVLFLTMLSNTRKQPVDLGNYTEGLRAAERGEIKEVTVTRKQESGEIKFEGTFAYDDKKQFTFTAIDLPEDWRTQLEAAGVEKINEAVEKPSAWFILMLQMLPILLLVGLFWFFAFRPMQAGGNKALSFGKSRARLHQQTDNVVTFDDVAGVEEAKQELHEIIEFLMDPKRFTRLGGKIPKGVLLVGPPGSGKTLLAKAVAGEAKVPFFTISGSDFVEMFVGVGASRVRDLFQQGQKHAPCIIFIDELDAVGRQRGAGLGGGHDEREQTLNQLLVEMDGFNSNEGVILMAATNRPDVLDRALLRPGRFDRQIVVDNPDLHGREGILKVHTKGKPLDENVDLSVVARGTPGFSGADLANLVNEAALLAARKGNEFITMEDFDESKDRVIMGLERRSMFISDRDRRMTAFHEAGHALVGRMLPGTDPVYKVTIIPRGRALGVTHFLPIEDRHTYPRTYLVNNITYMMGGRAAEELMFNEISNGAGNDIRMATEIARRMVCEWGMSERLGPVNYSGAEEVFLGRDLLRERSFSEEFAAKIDEEVQRIISSAHERAQQILTEHRAVLEAVATALIEKEVLEGPALDEIIKQFDVELPEREESSQPSSQAEASSDTPPTDEA